MSARVTGAGSLVCLARMRALLVFAPIALLAGFVVVRTLSGRPLTRRALDIAIALLLLAYLLVTAGLGLFWVARMDLPVFDWHYLFGYALLVVAAAHVSLQLRGLVRFFRPRAGPRRAAAQKSRGQPGALVALAGVLALVAAAGWLLRSPRRLLPQPSSPAASHAPAEDASATVAYLYRESSYSRKGLLRSAGLAPARPSETKSYAGNSRFTLPGAPLRAGASFGAALDAFRASPRAAAPLSLERLSALLFHANGVTSEGAGYRLRAAASSGALYPTDLYVVADESAELPSGVHYYDGTRHELVKVRGPEALGPLRSALPRLPGVSGAKFWLVFGSTFDRTAWKYNVRTYRYLGLDAGHVALNVATSARALELDCTPLPLFDDRALGVALALAPEHEAALLVFACATGPTPPHPAVSPRRRTATLPERAGEIELTRLSSSVTSVELAGGFDWLEVPLAPRAPGARALPSPAPSERDFRHASLEAGLSGEAAYLAATAAELGICGVGAFYDDEVEALFRWREPGPRLLYLAGAGVRAD